MKIGIVTFYKSQDNYGQILQCYALQEFLRKHGHIPFLIRFDEKKIKEDDPSKDSRILKLLRIICHLNTYFHLYKQQCRERKYAETANNSRRNFTAFIQDHIGISNQVYSMEELYQTPPKADAYICGSDQIWGGSLIYYLNFTPESAKRIAYAPSFGGISSFSLAYEKKLVNLLSRFDYLGIREQSGVETCKSLGFSHAEKVVDPTLLLTSYDYKSIRKESFDRKPFVFLYMLGNPSSLRISDVYKFAKQRGLEVVYVASQGQYDKFTKSWATIEEWVSYVAEATLVITNSFHCTVFSLIHETPFISVPLIGAYSRMNTRIEELLSESRLENRIYKGNIDQIYDTPISFDNFKIYRNIYVKSSAESLLNHLK